jgi:hypothetical protein
VLSAGRRFDYWESGMDLRLGEDFYDSFIEYQTQMLKVFDRMSIEYGFQILDASRSVRRVGAALRRAIAEVIDKEDSLESNPRQLPFQIRPVTELKTPARLTHEKLEKTGP